MQLTASATGIGMCQSAAVAWAPDVPCLLELASLVDSASRQETGEYQTFERVVTAQAKGTRTQAQFLQLNALKLLGVLIPYFWHESRGLEKCGLERRKQWVSAIGGPKPSANPPLYPGPERVYGMTENI